MHTVVVITGLNAQTETVFAILPNRTEAREYADGLNQKRKTAFRFYAARPLQESDIEALREAAY